jgi:hypothetical protein
MGKPPAGLSGCRYRCLDCGLHLHGRRECIGHAAISQCRQFATVKSGRVLVARRDGRGRLELVAAGHLP